MWVTVLPAGNVRVILSNHHSDPQDYCWDSQLQECLSVREKEREVTVSLIISSSPWSGLLSQSGPLLRRTCEDLCINYGHLCRGQCGPAQCRQGDSCLSELETSANFTRIRSEQGTPKNSNTFIPFIV